MDTQQTEPTPDQAAPPTAPDALASPHASSDGLASPPATVVYIDAAYLLTAMAAHHQANMSTTIFDARGIVAKVAQLIDHLSPGRTELRWYDAVDPTKRVETPWLAALRNHPDVSLRLGRITVREGYRLEQKRVDTLLVADVVEAVCSTTPPSDVVIVSGDEDLTPAVDVAVARGARVHLLTLAIDGSSKSVSRHLRLSVASERVVDILELAPLARSRSRMFAQMAGLLPKKADVTCDDAAEPAEFAPACRAEAISEDDPAADDQVSVWQPVLPGMPPDPADWAEQVDLLPSNSQDDLAVAEQSTLEDRVRAGQVSRAYLAGRAYARRWLCTEPTVRAEEVAHVLASHPYLPNSVDKGLMKFAAHHVGLGVGGKYNKVDVRAGFSSGVRRLAGLTGPEGEDVLPAGSGPTDPACAIETRPVEEASPQVANPAA